MNNAQEIAACIGRIVVNFNSLELILRRLVWFQIDSRNAEKGQAITKRLMFDEILALSFALLKAAPFDPEPQEIVKSVLHRMAGLKEKRNIAAHSLLRVKNEATDLSEIYSAWPQHHKHGAFHSDGAAIDIESLKATNDECIALSDDATQMLIRIGAGVAFGNIRR